MRPANKPALADAIWGLMPKDVVEPTGQSQYVLDGESLVHRIPWQRGTTYTGIIGSTQTTSPEYMDMPLCHDYVNTRGIDLVKTLGLMNVSQRRDYFMIMLMFKSIHGLVPNYLCDKITMQRDIAERTTRSTIDNNVHVPHITLECCKNAFAYRGPVLWNALPENIKKCESLNGVKQCLKLHVVG